MNEKSRYKRFHVFINAYFVVANSLVLPGAGAVLLKTLNGEEDVFQKLSPLVQLSTVLGVVLLLLLFLPTTLLFRPLRVRIEHVERAPGARLRRLAEICFSKKIYGLVFEPILSDLEVEYFQALAEGDRVKARFVLARGYVAFWGAFVMQLPVSLGKVVVELWLASK